MKKLNYLLLILLIPATGWSQYIDSTLIKKHIYYLASDKLKGRAPGTKGELKAAEYIAEHFSKYGLQPQGNTVGSSAIQMPGAQGPAWVNYSGSTKGYEKYFQPFAYHQSLNPHDTTTANKILYTGMNVIGYLDNGAANTIVIGAHYDQLGKDGRGSSLDAKPKGKVHNGADDNASGTAGVLELARYFSANNVKEKTNFLFICFSAEEAGLIGSKYFTANPTIPLQSIQCMINMDMVGRLTDSNKLIVYGVGTSDVLVPTLNEQNHNSFSLVLDSSGIGPSDQTSFYLKQIPVLHFFTGQHTDYHKPTDDANKINYTGEAKVLDYIRRVAEQLASLPKMKYQETGSKDMGSRAAFKVTLGIMPDYAYPGKGLRIDSVLKGKVAEKAGLKNGDIILKLGDVEVGNINDYMKGLQRFNPGEKAVVELKRGNETIQTTVTF